ncbi:hypothetical protein [Rhizobium multihospitium]|uniref:Uncharacterized protein n=1 Tax=Rhizobium multihospitium TaxID=410764 RepID=A0A1C3VH23_9HYPH|nr:hypothetical protein [Rhizobium multihospitium]SCB26989.1 hypothetical protein GA0061103_3749 [Rhizobium multihospitium]
MAFFVLPESEPFGYCLRPHLLIREVAIGLAIRLGIGVNVRPKIRALLNGNRDFQALLKAATKGPQNTPSNTNSRSDLVNKLNALRIYISELEREVISSERNVGVGHNNPPELLANGELHRSEFEQVRQDIQAIEEEVGKEEPNTEAVNRHINSLMKIGLKVALWVGERVTKFTDASLTVLAPIVVAKATGLAPVLFDAVAAASRFFIN